MENQEIEDAIETLQKQLAKQKNPGLQEDFTDMPQQVSKPQKAKAMQKTTQKQKPPQKPQPQEDNPQMENLKRQLAEALKIQLQHEMQQPQQKPQNLPPWGRKPINSVFNEPAKPQQAPQPNGQPKFTDTIEVLQKLQENKAFVTTATKYGAALAASILAKLNTMPTNRINFEETAKHVIEIKGGSYALIYKSNNTPVRITPFIWSLDQSTRRVWAVFTFNNFYGNKNPNQLKIWRTVSTQIVVTPFDYSSDMVDNFGKGYLAKYDESTQGQMPIHMKDTKDIEIIKNMTKNFMNAALTLWMDLSQLTKPKLNIRMLLIIFGIAAIAVLAYYIFKTHPNLLSGLTNILHG